MEFDRTICLTLMTFVIGVGCGRNVEKAASTPTATPAPAASQPATTPPTETSTPAASPAAAVQPPPAPVEPPKPPEPKKYTLDAGTPITVRTIADVSIKTNQTGTSFEATLQSPLVVDGHTLAKTGSTVFGSVVSSDQGGRVKGRASLTLALTRLHLANGQNIAIQTNSVVQEAKSGTKKNLARTGIASGAGAAIGAIAGGGRGAAIGAGIGAGAGVATNLATRGPAAKIPPETVLHFTLASPVTITEKP
jgi:hypothetical protein